VLLLVQVQLIQQEAILLQAVQIVLQDVPHVIIQTVNVLLVMQDIKSQEQVVLHVQILNIAPEAPQELLLARLSGLIVQNVMLRHVLHVQADTRLKMVLVYRIF